MPPSSLNDFIKYFWYYEHKAEDFEFIVLPDACFDLVVDFEKNELKNIFLTGVWTGPKKLVVTKGTTLFAIRFKVLAAEYLFHREINSLLDTMVLLPENFWNIEKIIKYDFEKFSSVLSNNIITILLKSKDLDNRKLKLFDLIYNKRIYRVNELAKSVYWSSRQINRYFNTQFGFPLKKFLNMVRCHDSYEEIANGYLYPSMDHTDQAHFIKEIKKYTENTPRQLYKNDNGRFIQLSPLKKK